MLCLNNIHLVIQIANLLKFADFILAFSTYLVHQIRFSREEIALEDGHIFNFKRPVTLTSDDLESYIVLFVSSTSIQRYMVHMAPLQMSWTDGRTDGQTFPH